MRMTSKGQVTIPKKVREKLGVGPGDEIGFREEGGQMLIVPETGQKGRSKGASLLKNFDDIVAKLKREGKLAALGMSVDEYMELLRGYSEDADDPGFKRTP